MLPKYTRSFEGNTPILLEMPHSGRVGITMTNNIPSVISSKLRFVSKAVRQTIGFGCDSAVPDMTGFIYLVQNCGLSGVYNGLARVYCDTNRGKSEISNLALMGGSVNQHRSGVIWATTVPTNVDILLPTEELVKMVGEQSEKMFETPLSVDEFQTLTSEVYDPYHAAIQSQHKRIMGKYGSFIHLALHSLPPLSVTKVHGGYVCGQKAKRGPFDINKNTLPDVILIHNNYQAAAKVLVDRVRYAFESAGLIVEDGTGPFLGDIGVTKLYGDAVRGFNVLGIEHVTHDIEPERHLGNTAVNYGKALALRPVYAKAIENLLKE